MDCEGAIYEPRVLWEVFFRDNEAATFRLTSTKEHWHNGSRYPITVTDFLLSPINYPTMDFGGDEAASQINEAEITLAVRGAHYSAREFSRLTMFPAKPISEPRMRYSASTHASGLFGLSRWDFDKRYTLPQGGSIQFDISNWTPESVEPNINAGEEPQVSMLWYEPGNWMLGAQARVLARGLIAETSGAAWPAGPGALSVSTPKAATPGDIWTRRFTPTSFAQQNATRSGTGSGIGGFAVLIDQITKDDVHAATFANQIFTPFSQRVITRCRTANGGTGEWWWRQGAPLCLVTPTIGSALAYRLVDPIVLEPGAQLEIELQVPATAPDVGTTYHVGLAACGYATVEG